MKSKTLYLEMAKAHLLESANLKQRLSEEGVGSIVEAAYLVTAAFNSGNKLLLCGNGGSAADCQHLAAEFVNRLTSDIERQGLPALALTTDTSFLTAYANDYGFDGIFKRQVETFGKTGDVLLCISTSGNSPNVLYAAEAARSLGIKIIALVGEGGKLVEISDVVISAPSGRVQYIQEAHLAIEHILCDLVERILFNKPVTHLSERSQG
jgi:phosphoheptose isomerase